MLSFGNKFPMAWFCAMGFLCCQAYDLGEGERVIQTLEDHIDAENFTYYRLHRDGQLKLILMSLEGDVDIFASSEIQHPSFYNYELKSETCGLDVITIPSEMARPVYIGLYGHPRNLHSRFTLSILSVPKPITVSYEDLVAQFERFYYDDAAKSDIFRETDRNRHSTPESDRSGNVVEDDMPTWAKIFLGILEFGLEALL